MLNHLKPLNFILATDGYKCNHWLEVPPGIDYSYAAIVPRKVSKYSKLIVAMGQAMLSSYLASVRITKEMVDEAEIEITQQGYNFNRKGWDDIVADGGALPLQVMGVDEGTLIKPQTPIVTISNTRPGFAWLVPYVEPFSQSLIWTMSTVATICRSVRETLYEYCLKTGTDTELVNFMLHYFGDRASRSPHEAAVLAGISHAVLFDGSDSVRANGYIKRLYRTEKPYTTSIEATEHGSMCANSDAEKRDDWGAALMAVKRLEARVKSYEEDGIGQPKMSAVIDTYDPRRFVREYIGTRLRERIRASRGVLICRPDSNDPRIEPSLVAVDLMDTFINYTLNQKGYVVLEPCVAVIQGDGVNIDTYEGVLEGWVGEETGSPMAMDSFALGMGSGIANGGERDDFSFSMKTIAEFVEGQWRRLLKDPITDKGKRSLSGLIYVGESSTGEIEVRDAMEEDAVWRPFTENRYWKNWSTEGMRNYVPDFDDVQLRARAGTM